MLINDACREIHLGLTPSRESSSKRVKPSDMIWGTVNIEMGFIATGLNEILTGASTAVERGPGPSPGVF